MNTETKGVSEVPTSQLVRAYVWELPVRVAHWLIFVAFTVLAFTGYYIHRPFLSPGVYLMATVRFVHLVAAFVFIAAVIVRIYWFFKGNFWARWTAFVPIHKYQWDGLGDVLKYYLFLRFTPAPRVGHNALAALSYLVIYLLMLVEILTGLGLYSYVLSDSLVAELFGWLPRAIPVSYLREIHFFVMFLFFAFVIFHVYASVLISLEERSGLLDSIFTGWKFVPLWELKHEVAEIPEAKTGPRERVEAGRLPPVSAERGPRPSFVQLYRNWVSYGGTALMALAFIAFLFLLAIQLSGRAFASPYGSLIIFILVPAFILPGILIIFGGMFWQWIRWRSKKPISYGRYPALDLNRAEDRKGLTIFVTVAVVLGAATLYGSYRAYQYSESVPFCGTLCHRVMEPEYVTYLNSPHAKVECVACHVGPGPRWFLQAKVRGAVQAYETLGDNYPRPIPTPLQNLRPARAICESCHWPRMFFGGKQQRLVRFLSDQANTQWEINMLVRVGGGTHFDPQAGGIHWHMNINNRVEYIAIDRERQQIPWVRVTNLKTGQAAVYSSRAEPLTDEAILGYGVRTMDCMDCHNRPTHILASPTRSVDWAMADNRIDPSLPGIKQTAVALLAKRYESRDEGLRAISDGIQSYYRDNYPEMSGTQQQKLSAAVSELQSIYRDYFFPYMRVRWETYPENSSHLLSPGCWRCHDGQHRSVDGKTIENGCTTCHAILQQGKPGQLSVASGPEGLRFEHPVPIGGMEFETPCYDCHTGAGQ
jgi:Ni/Fe-hydrogenase b-type cytochrome subunit